MHAMKPSRHHRPPAAIFAAALMLTVFSSYGQNAQALQTRALAATCANCHGTDGNAVQGQAMPRLAGLQKSYIVEQMQAFRDGKRPATVMHQLAKGYNNEQIDALAGFFAAQK
jgi:cytochrome subunit of sulfide dehydrogenase